jgi:hypothetical protein
MAGGSDALKNKKGSLHLLLIKVLSFLRFGMKPGENH